MRTVLFITIVKRFVICTLTKTEMGLLSGYFQPGDGCQLEFFFDKSNRYP